MVFRRRWQVYTLAAVSFVLGLALCAFLTLRIYHGMLSYSRSYEHVVIPGRAKITIVEPGNYTIFHEYKSVTDDLVYSVTPDSISGLGCSLQNKDSGLEVPLKSSTSNSKYSLGGREGIAIFSFYAARPGAYEIDCAYSDGETAGPKTVLAIGQGFVGEIFKIILSVFGIIVLFTLSISVSTVIIIYGIIRRKPVDPAINR